MHFNFIIDYMNTQDRDRSEKGDSDSHKVEDKIIEGNKFQEENLYALSMYYYKAFEEHNLKLNEDHINK
jgi:hypothetical protein